MAFANVNPFARMWRDAGLKYILTTPEYVRAREAESRKRAPALAPRAGSKKPQFVAAPLEKKEPLPAAPENQWKAAPIETWPQGLQALFKTVKPAQIAWTYPELGADLAFSRIGVKEADSGKRKARGNFLRKLFQQLAFPAGTHCFWPLDDSEDNCSDNASKYDVFWSAILRLHCKGLIVFGSAASAIALPGKTVKPLSCFRMHGVPVIVLWDINGLAERDGVFDQVCEYLRAYLRQIIPA